MSGNDPHEIAMLADVLDRLLVLKDFGFEKVDEHPTIMSGHYNIIESAHKLDISKEMTLVNKYWKERSEKCETVQPVSKEKL